MLIAWMKVGFEIFDEWRFYSMWELLGLLGSVLTCLVGVKHLTVRHSLAVSQGVSEAELA